MKQSLKFTVFFSPDSKAKNKPIFERVVWSDSDVHQDFNNLFASFRYLFGEKCLIVVESIIV